MHGENITFQSFLQLISKKTIAIVSVISSLCLHDAYVSISGR